MHTVEEYSVGTSRPYRGKVSSSFTGSQIIPSSHRPISSGGGHAIRNAGMTSIGAGPGQADPQNEYSPTKEAGEDVSMSGITEQKMESEGDGQNKSQYPSSTGSFQPSSESSPVKTVPPLPWPSLLPSNIDQEASVPISSDHSSKAMSLPPSTITPHIQPLNHVSSRSSKGSSSTLGHPTSPPSRGEYLSNLNPANFTARPPSVASSNSSYPRGIGLGPGPGGKATLAPAMTVTTSHDKGGEDLYDDAQSPFRVTSPVSEASSSPENGKKTHSSRASKSHFSALGTSPGDTPSGTSALRTGMAAMGKRRESKSSIQSDGKVSAIDILRKIDKSSGTNLKDGDM